MPSIFDMVATAVYASLALIALWGLYNVVMVWTRVGQKRFRNEQEQVAFLDAIEEPLLKGEFDSVYALCEGDRRAMPQLIQIAVANRDIGYKKIRQLVLDRFQRDVLGDLEHRLTWVGTVIKSAPMIGLFGTVLGMMGAFTTLATAEKVEPAALASDIGVALQTTACGLAIAIPLVICTASVNIRIRKMEDLVGAGLTRFLDSMRTVLEQTAGQRK